MKDFTLERERILQSTNKKINKIKSECMTKIKEVVKDSNDKITKLEKIVAINNKNKVNNIIPVFYASDNNYLPYLSVSLQSLKENASKSYIYKIFILHNDIKKENQKAILEYNEEFFNIEFVDVSKKFEDVKNGLQLRDYYSGATYYRIFIANMFLEYDKAIYLDSDTIILGDISNLYKYNLGNNYVGAVSDKVVGSNSIFKQYSRDVLGIESTNYFNAGVLLMNLKKFRENGFYEQFRELLLEYKFRVAQDQDYLNVICKDQVLYLPYSWNTMPIGGEGRKLPNIIHYNLTMKPWHYADIPYAKYFWKYAQINSYSDDIRKAFGCYTLAMKRKDDIVEANLLALAQEEIEREDNFIKMRMKSEEEYLDGISSELEYCVMGARE